MERNQKCGAKISPVKPNKKSKHRGERSSLEHRLGKPFRAPENSCEREKEKKENGRADRELMPFEKDCFVELLSHVVAL